MPNSWFSFKEFTVYHDRCGMKIGTDGVLLGAWADITNSSTILDIGTGTGLLALMSAQRSNAQIDAVEIDQDAFLQAKENIGKSKFKERIKVFHADIKDYNPDKKYDTIICNPPFFIDSLKAPDIKRSTARHDHTLSQRVLLTVAEKLLNDDGSLFVVYPFAEAQLMKKTALEEGFYSTTELHIRPSPAHDVKRVCMRLQKHQKQLSVTTLIIEEKGRHNYSADYINLTKDFYLKF